jgi:nitrogen fixation protein NifU and related proteins
MIYSDKVMDHFSNPRNVGTLPDADGVGQVGNPVCGDMMTFYIKVKDGRLSDIKFQTFGCGAAIAVSSMVSEMALGKTLDEALAISNEKVAEELGGLPKNKMHCSNLGADALHLAIQNYKARRADPSAPAVATDGGVEHDHGEEPGAETKDENGCPYCEGPVGGEEKIPSCQTCGLELAECPACGLYTDKSKPACTHCNALLAG